MAVSRHKNAVSFRHPLILDSNGYGKIIRRGVGKLPNKVAGRIQDELEQLLKIKPRLRSEVAQLELHPLALDFWFEPLQKNREKERAVQEREADEAEQRKKRDEFRAMHKRLADICATEGFSFDASRWDSDTHHLIGFILTTINRLERKNNDQFRTIAELQSQIEGLTRATGQQTEREKGLTLSDCLEHFKKNIDCKSEAAKKDVLRRVGDVVERLGLRTRHCNVTKATILDAVKGLCPNGGTEHIYKLRDVKRFFREISFAPESGGLGLQDPAKAIKPGTPEKKTVTVLDPREVGKVEKLSVYWKALAASCGFAGMRLGEAANLEWHMLDEKAKIIHLRVTKHYPNLKNEISERDIKPFGNFWRVIAEHRKQATHADLIFPRLWTSARPAEHRRFKNADNPTWFEDRDGRPKAVNLPGEFADALERSGFKQAKPAQRLRHFWVTEMEARGLGHLLDSMGGNSARVRQKHYIRHASVVAAANVPTL